MIEKYLDWEIVVKCRWPLSRDKGFMTGAPINSGNADQSSSGCKNPSVRWWIGVSTAWRSGDVESKAVSERRAGMTRKPYLCR
jgi:hypothetical protein